MRRLIIVFIGFLLVFSASVFLAAATGYFAHRTQIAPLYNLAERAIVKGRRVLGLPTETVSMVDRVETTYLTLRGTIYGMPNNDFKPGGALALWGEDVLAMHKSGAVFYLGEEDGLVRSGLAVPDNGLEAYVRLAQKKYPDRWENRLHSIRYNDIEFIDIQDLLGQL